MLINRVREITEELVGEEQGGFRKGKGCVDQIFVMRNIVEKHLERGKKVYAAFMDLEKAYDRVDREGLWRVLRIYGV
ncbi:reverse transcriptase domain-containing protein, partial [Klebsiella pneumoniae]|uniref:reverse transcriptase domain-containing protein n=1 Tax=Klebsiella pneumoniae TaxID=573 RepID=UPI003EBA3048